MTELNERPKIKDTRTRTFTVEGNKPIPVEWLKDFVNGLPDGAMMNIYRFEGTSYDPGYTKITVVEEM